MLDVYMDGAVHRLCREAPVPIVEAGETLLRAGGAANTAVNAAALGANTSLLSVVGEDREGYGLSRLLMAAGVDTEGLHRHHGRETITKERITTDGHLLLRIDRGGLDRMDGFTEGILIEWLAEKYAKADGIVISDYGYGVVTDTFIQQIKIMQDKNPRLLVVDSKEPDRFRPLRPAVVKPNYEEIRTLLGLTRSYAGEERVSQLWDKGRDILKLTGARRAAVTLDHDGALLFEKGRPVPYRTYARQLDNMQAVGAGDTFTSALALAMASGAGGEMAMELASAASAVVVQKNGTTTCTKMELELYLISNNKSIARDMDLQEKLKEYRSSGQSIVFTNGCFDILHSGHVGYLEKAKSLGDVLVVGLNTDASVRRLKGETRPINSLEERIKVLSAITAVDLIVPFAEDTPVNLIKKVRPDYFVKGGDYSREILPETPVVEALGGKVEILPYIPERSTTNTIRKILAAGQAG